MDERTKKVFDLFDKDGDGKISKKELEDVMKTLGKGDAELGNIDGFLTERGGCIDFDAFKELLNPDQKMTLDKTAEVTDLQEAFKLLDRKGNGYIGSAELLHICKKLGIELTAEQADEMVSEALIGYNGQIYYDGLLKILITQ